MRKLITVEKAKRASSMIVRQYILGGTSEEGAEAKRKEKLPRKSTMIVKHYILDGKSDSEMVDATAS